MTLLLLACTSGPARHVIAYTVQLDSQEAQFIQDYGPNGDHTYLILRGTLLSKRTLDGAELALPSDRTWSARLKDTDLLPVPDQARLELQGSPQAPTAIYYQNGMIWAHGKRSP